MRAPEEAYAVERFEQAAALLPHELREGVQRLSTAEKARAEEFRLRGGQTARWLQIRRGNGRYRAAGQCPITAADLTGVLEVASQASTHTVLDRVKSGFVTVRGGYRVGLCGSAVMKDGEVCNVKQISSLAIRIARRSRGRELRSCRVVGGRHPAEYAPSLAARRREDDSPAGFDSPHFRRCWRAAPSSGGGRRAWGACRHV